MKVGGSCVKEVVTNKEPKIYIIVKSSTISSSIWGSLFTAASRKAVVEGKKLTKQIYGYCSV